MQPARKRSGPNPNHHEQPLLLREGTKKRIPPDTHAYRDKLRRVSAQSPMTLQADSEVATITSRVSTRSQSKGNAIDSEVAAITSGVLTRSQSRAKTPSAELTDPEVASITAKAGKRTRAKTTAVFACAKKPSETERRNLEAQAAPIYVHRIQNDQTDRSTWAPIIASVRQRALKSQAV